MKGFCNASTLEITSQMHLEFLNECESAPFFMKKGFVCGGDDG